jgi:putative Holliday junction resolvase
MVNPTRALLTIDLAEAETEPKAREASINPAGRLLAIDLGAKRVGVAVSDELRITIKPLAAIERRSWKDLLRRIVALMETFDARALVIGLPLRMDGVEGDAARDARTIAHKFERSLGIPVVLQDERLTSVEAASILKSAARSDREIKEEIDSAAAVLILRDFIVGESRRHDDPGIES